MRGDLLKRLEKLEAGAGRTVTLTLKDGKLYRIPGKRWGEACSEAASGHSTPDAKAIRAAVSCDESGKMLGLVQALVNSL